ncbi:MAG TPA: hypothetical protein VIN40_01230 [Candidatus Tyrphobacter sp.]
MKENQRRAAARFAAAVLSVSVASVVPAYGQSAAPSAAASASPDGMPDASAIYAKMVLAMSAQRSPSAASYDVTFTPRGLGLRIIDVRGKAVIHLAYISDSTPHLFHVTQSDDRDTSEIVDAVSRQRQIAERPFWSVTWAGDRPGAASATPADQTTVIESAREKAVADLLTASDDAYGVTLVGIENLNGAAVYHLHLTAQNAAAHPLTDLFVDERSFLARRAVAGFTDHTVATVTGVITLNFWQVGRYWMLTSGEVDATVHAFFRQVSGSATFASSNLTFPR